MNDSRENPKFIEGREVSNLETLDIGITLSITIAATECAKVYFLSIHVFVGKCHVMEGSKPTAEIPTDTVFGSHHAAAEQTSLQ